MLLILQIAIGLVLGVLLLAWLGPYLGALLMSAAAAGVVLLAGAAALFVWYGLDPTAGPPAWWFLLAVVAGAIGTAVWVWRENV